MRNVVFALLLFASFSASAWNPFAPKAVKGVPEKTAPLDATKVKELLKASREKEVEEGREFIKKDNKRIQKKGAKKSRVRVSPPTHYEKRVHHKRKGIKK